jgi:hypothetical protein
VITKGPQLGEGDILVEFENGTPEMGTVIAQVQAM